MKSARAMLIATMVLVLVLMAGLAGCGDEDEDTDTAAASGNGATSSATTAEKESATVEMEDIQFNPEDFTVKKGEALTWVNLDSVSHTVTSDDDLFDSGLVKEGEEFVFTFDEAGTYPYTCTVHPTVMTGTVTVEE